jgi:hypothetical protein
MDGVWNCGYPRNNGYNNQILVIWWMSSFNML